MIKFCRNDWTCGWSSDGHSKDQPADDEHQSVKHNDNIRYSEKGRGMSFWMNFIAYSEIISINCDECDTSNKCNVPQVHGLYRGMLFPLVCSGTLNSVFFGVYGYCLRNLQELRGHPQDFNMPTTSGWYWDTFLGGCIGGFVQVIVACPSEVVKVRLQSGKVI